MVHDRVADVMDSIPRVDLVSRMQVVSSSRGSNTNEGEDSVERC